MLEGIIAGIVVFAIWGLIIHGSARLLLTLLIGLCGVCGKFARVIDRTPDRILIPSCIVAAPLVFVGILFSLFLLAQL